MTAYELIPGTPQGRPLASAWPAYRGMSPLADLTGGCVLALVVVAQGIAAASVATVSVTAGIYSGILPPLVYGLVGSSRHASVGAGGVVSLVVAEQVAHLEAIEDRTKMASALALVAGLVMFTMGTFGLSFLVRFVSRPALSGLMSASGLGLIYSQRAHVLGLGVPFTNHMSPVEAFLHRVNPATGVLSAVIVVLILVLRRWDDRGGALGQLAAVKELVAVAVGLLLAMLAARSAQLEEFPIELLGEVPAGFPKLTLPLGSLQEVGDLLPGACAVALTAFMSSFAGSKTVALQQGYDISATRELLALGLSSSLGGCSGGIPILGSLNRTALAATMVRSQLGAGVMVAVGVTLAVEFLSPVLQRLPLCVIACLIVTSSIPLVNWREPLRLYRLHSSWDERGDLLTWSCSFAATLFCGMVAGICVSVALSIALLIHDVAQPVVQELGRTPAGLWIRLANVKVESQPAPGTLVLRVDGPLFFANAEYVQDRICELAAAAEDTRRGDAVPFRHVILEASKVTFLDATSVDVLADTAKGLQARGLSLSIVEAPVRAHDVLQRNLPHLHPLGERGVRVTVDEVIELVPPILVPRADQ